MAVRKDFKCSTHGYFESRQAVCPMKDCQGEIHVVFLQPPGIKTERTKRTDSTLKGLAQEFGMTNLKSTREGEHQDGYLTRNNATDKESLAREAEIAAQQNKEARPGDAAIWGGGMNGMSMASVLAGKYAQPIGPTLGKEAESVGVNLKETPNLTGPRAASYISDHENLEIKP